VREQPITGVTLDPSRWPSTLFRRLSFALHSSSLLFIHELFSLFCPSYIAISFPVHYTISFPLTTIFTSFSRPFLWQSCLHPTLATTRDRLQCSIDLSHFHFRLQIKSSRSIFNQIHQAIILPSLLSLNVHHSFQNPPGNGHVIRSTMMLLNQPKSMVRWQRWILNLSPLHLYTAKG
jgi:hypothetical protein